MAPKKAKKAASPPPPLPEPPLVAAGELKKAQEVLAKADEKKKARSSLVHYLNINNLKESYDTSSVEIKRNFFEGWFAKHLADKTVKGQLKSTKSIESAGAQHHLFSWMAKQQMIDTFGKEKALSKIESGNLKTRPDQDSGKSDEWNIEYQIWHDAGGMSE
eukprot:6803862-Pyramimonas_sp.AAC.1